jgi:peptide/nickel transport system substrate-binding protein
LSRVRQLAVAAAVCLLIGCRSDPPGTPTPAARSAAPTPRPQQLSVAQIADPKTFNPILVTDTASGAAIGDLFDPLLRLDAKTTEVEPFIAQRWEHDAGGTEWTFFLRRDVRWHDGRPLTADDVVFTFAAIFDDRVPNSYKYSLLVDGKPIDVQAIDPHTVRIRLPRPFAPLLNSIGVPIIPKHVLGEALANGTFAQKWGIDTPPEQLIGSGPYRMARYVQSQFIQLRRNPDWWMRDADGRSLPYLEEHTLRIVPNMDTMYLKFLSGETDIHSARPEEVSDLRDREAALGVRVEEVGPDTGTLFVIFNRNPRHYQRNGTVAPQLSWFTDTRFLRALAHSIDKRSIINNCLFGLGQPAVAYISPANARYHNPNLTEYAYDLDTARRLLEEAGYRNVQGVLQDPKGNPVEFSLNTNAGNQIREKVCSIVKEDWSQLGIRVNYRPIDFSLLVEKLDTTFDWDAILIGFTGSVEPHNGANLLRSDGNLHMWNPNQPAPATPWEAEIDRLVDAGVRELDEEKRQPIYWRIQEIFHEQLPMIQTVRQTQYTAYKTALRDYVNTVWGIHRPELMHFAE